MDFDKNTPIYKQIVNYIIQQIETGELNPGQKLPTERELCNLLGVSRGTIKTAFKELEYQGKVEIIQGSGTFVAGGKSEKESKYMEEQLDIMLQKMDRHHLRKEEVKEKVLDYIMHHLEGNERIRFAWVDCTHEFFGGIQEQLEKDCNFKVDCFVLEDAIRHIKYLEKNYDLIATTARHYPELASAASRQILRAAISLDRTAVRENLKIKETDKVAALYHSKRMLRSIYEQFVDLSVKVPITAYQANDEYSSLLEHLDRYNAIVVGVADEEKIRDEIVRLGMENDIKVIVYRYFLDEGSIVSLGVSAKEYWRREAGEEWNDEKQGYFF